MRERRAPDVGVRLRLPLASIIMIGWAQSWMQDVLAHALSEFVDVEKESLHFSLRNGVSMSNVRLKTDQLERLQLPVTFVRGTVGHLKLQVPWMNLMSGASKIVLSVSGVELVFVERDEAEWEGASARQRDEAAKQARLASFEMDLLSRALARHNEDVDAEASCATPTSSGPAVPHDGKAKASGAFSLGSLTSSWLSNLGKLLLSKLVVCVEDASVELHATDDSPSAQGEADTLAGTQDSRAALAPAPAEDVRGSGSGSGHEDGVDGTVIGLSIHRLETVQERPSAPHEAAAAGEEGAPTTWVTLQGFRVYHCDRGASGEEGQAHDVLQPLSCETRVCIFHNAGGASSSHAHDASASDVYEISCTLSAVSVDLDKHFVQKAFVLLDKSEVWNLRSIYGRFRPPGWRTAAHGAKAPQCTRRWARQGWTYAYRAVLCSIRSGQTPEERLRRLAIKHPLGVGKYEQFYREKMRRLACGESKQEPGAPLAFLREFERQESAEDVIALRRDVASRLPPDWMSQAGMEENRTTALSSFWSNWVKWKVGSNSGEYRGEGEDGGGAFEAISHTRIDDMQSIYDKIVSQLPRTPPKVPRRPTGPDQSGDDSVCFVSVDVAEARIRLLLDHAKGEHPLVESLLIGAGATMDVYESGDMKVSLQVGTVAAHAGGKPLAQQAMRESAPHGIDVAVDLFKVGLDKHLGVKATCIVQPVLLHIPSPESLLMIANFTEPFTNSHHLSWLSSTNQLKTDLARSHAKAEYLMQYPFLNLQVLLTEVRAIVPDRLTRAGGGGEGGGRGGGDHAVEVKLRDLSLSSSRTDTADLSNKVSMALRAVRRRAEHSPGLVREYVMYHKFFCTVANVEASLVQGGGGVGVGVGAGAPSKLLSTSVWSELDLLLLPDDSTQAGCKAHVNFSPIRLTLSLPQLLTLSKIGDQYSSGAAQSAPSSPEDGGAETLAPQPKSNADLRIRMQSIVLDLKGFQGAAYPSTDALKLSVKGLKAGIMTSELVNESFVSICSLRLEQKSEMGRSCVLLNMSLQELMQDNPVQNVKVNSDTQDLYSNSIKSFQKVTPEKGQRVLFKGSLNQRTWTSSALSLALMERTLPNKNSKAIVCNAFCARINIRLIDCVWNVIDAVSKSLPAWDALPSHQGAENQGKTEEELSVDVSITNYVIEAAVSEDREYLCEVSIPKVNFAMQFDAQSLQYFEVSEKNLYVLIRDQEGQRYLVKKFDLGLKMNVYDCMDASRSEKTYRLVLTVPCLYVILQSRDLCTLCDIVRKIPMPSGKVDGKVTAEDTSGITSFPGVLHATADIAHIQFELCPANPMQAPIFALLQQLALQVSIKDNVIDNFGCNWNLLGIFVMKDNDAESGRCRVPLISFQPKHSVDEIPIIETNIQESPEVLHAAIKNVQVDVNVFSWDMLLSLVEELKASMDFIPGDAESAPSVNQHGMPYKEILCTAEDLDIHVHFHHVHDEQKEIPPIIAKTKLSMHFLEKGRDYLVDSCVNHLLVDVPQILLDDNEEEFHAFTTMAFFDHLVVSMKTSEALDSIVSKATLGSLSLWLTHHNLVYFKTLLGSMPIPHQQQGAPDTNKNNDATRQDAEACAEVTFSCQKIAALFCDDRFHTDVPIAEMAVGDVWTQVTVDPTTTSECIVSCNVLLDFYNYDKVAWDPFVEKWQVDAYYRGSDARDLRKKLPSHEVSIQANSELNVNISEYTIETGIVLQHMLQSVLQDAGADKNPSALRSTKFTPYWLQNQSGAQILYSFSDSTSSTNLTDYLNKQAHLAIQEDMVPLFIRKSSGRGGRHVSYKYLNARARSESYVGASGGESQWVNGRPVIHFKVGKRSWSKPIAMNTYAKHVISLQDMGEAAASGTKIICDVQRRVNGGRLILLHSCISIVNKCSYTVQVASCCSASGERILLREMKADEAFWMPADICTSGSIALRVCVGTEETSWSREIKLSDMVMEKNTAKPFLAHCNYGRDDTCALALNVASVSEDEHVIAMHSPVKIRNQLPVPLQMLVYRGSQTLADASMHPDSELDFYNVKGSSQLALFLRLKPRGYHWASGLAIPTQHAEAGHDFVWDNETLLLDEATSSHDSNKLSIEVKYIGSHPMTIHVCCPMWIYNHTGLHLGVRAKDTSNPFQRVLPLWHGDEGDQGNGKQGTGTLSPQRVDHTPVGLSILSSELHAGPQRRRAESSPYPTMFGVKSYQHYVGLQLRAAIDTQAKHHIVSKPFTLEVLGEPELVQILTQSEDSELCRIPKAYLFTVTTELSPFGGNSVCVHIRPKFVLMNNLKTPVIFRQEGSSIKRELSSGERQAVHADSLAANVKLSIRLKDSVCQWSGYFRLNKPGGVQMRMGTVGHGKSLMIQLDVKESSFETWVVSVSEYQAGFAPYRIDNYTNDMICYYQLHCDASEEMLQPYSSAIYTWDEPHQSHTMVLRLPGYGILGSFLLDKVGEAHVFSVPEGVKARGVYGNPRRKLQVIVRADGPTRVLSISDVSSAAPHKGLSDLPMVSKKLLGMPSYGSKQGEAKLQQPSPQDSVMLLDVNISHIGVSVIGKKSEVLYLGLLGLKLKYNGGESHDAVAFGVQKIQMDNMMPDATFPVVLAVPAPLYQGDASSRSTNYQAVDCKVSYWHAGMAGVTCIESLIVDVSPILLDLDGAVILDLHHFADFIAWAGSSARGYAAQAANNNASPRSSANALAILDGDLPEPKKGARLYVESMKVSPIHISVSFSTANLFSEKLLASDRFPKGLNAQLLYALSFAEFEGVRVLLTSLDVQHLLIDKGAMQSLLSKHYVRALLREAVKILGSANVLGDPLGLVSHLSTGMWDFFSKSILGLFQSAHTLGLSKFTAGLSAGSRSLLSHTVYAIFNATWKFSKTAQRNVTAVRNRCELYLEHTQRSPAQRQMLQGGTDPSMIGALSRGIGGMVAAPIHGAEQNGLKGFVEGATVGMVGAVASPAATLLELVQHTSKALRDLAQRGIVKTVRLRPPRIIEEDRPLLPYSYSLSLGHVLLDRAAIHEPIVFSAVLEAEPSALGGVGGSGGVGGGRERGAHTKDKVVLVLTSAHLIQAKVARDEVTEVEYRYSLGDLVSVEEQPIPQGGGQRASVHIIAMRAYTDDHQSGGWPIRVHPLFFAQQQEAASFVRNVRDRIAA